jgi:uncharacterized protein YjiK
VRKRLLLAGVLLVLAADTACRTPLGQPRRSDTTAGLTKQDTLLTQREIRLKAAIDQHQGDSATPLARWVLPKGLAEISGLALTDDQRLLAHNDEAGRIFEIDYRRGVVVKSFWLGSQNIVGDFEAIAVAGDRIFLLASKGALYEFKEGADRARVPVTVHDTRLGKECEFEGLAFDPAANALVLACKNVGTKSLRESVVLYRYSLTGVSTDAITPVTIPLVHAIGANGWKGFTPSDLSIDPGSGDYLIIASQERGLLRITPAGEVVWSRPLPSRHQMPEGVAITKDSLLIVSDEAASPASPAAITVYRWP